MNYWLAKYVYQQSPSIISFSLFSIQFVEDCFLFEMLWIHSIFILISVKLVVYFSFMALNDRFFVIPVRFEWVNKRTVTHISIILELTVLWSQWHSSKINKHLSPRKYNNGISLCIVSYERSIERWEQKWKH